MSDDVSGGREPSWISPEAAFDGLELNNPVVEKAAHQRAKCRIIVALKMTNEPVGSNLQGIQIWRTQRIKKERDRAARTENGIRLLVQLAEALQAQVIDQGGRMNFPNTHYLSRSPAAVSNADVIIGLELSDFWGTVNGYIDNGVHGIGINTTKIKPNTKLISISSVDLNTKSNYQDFQRFQVIDVQMAADAEATLPALIEAVKAAIPNDRKWAIDKRGDAAKKAFAEARAPA
jgi:hypothetical protein